MMTNNWSVYLLRCADDSLYCGISNNLSKRLQQHNGKLGGGAKYTRSRRPCQLAFQQKLSSKSEALKRELEIKNFSRQQKLNLIATSA